MKTQSWVKTHWKTSVGVIMIGAAVVLLLFSVGIFGQLFTKPVSAENATLGNFTIVADADSMEQAHEMYYAIAKLLT